MRIAIHSASAAVRRTLEHIIVQSGHQMSGEATAADLLIEDTLNPVTSSFSYPLAIQLVTYGASEHTLICPFRPQALIQRLTMLGSTPTIALGAGWALDMQARNLTHPDVAALTLTEKECLLLNALASSSLPLTREHLLEQVWGMAGDIDTHTLETHIYRLRAKLEPLAPSPCDILTQGGAYTLLIKD